MQTVHVHLPILYPSCQSDFNWSIPALDYWSKAKNNCNHHATPFHQVIATSTSNTQQSKAWLLHLCKYKDRSCCSCMHASKYHFYINRFTHVYHKNPDQLLLYFIFIYNMLPVISFKHMCPDPHHESSKMGMFTSQSTIFSARVTSSGQLQRHVLLHANTDSTSITSHTVSIENTSLLNYPLLVLSRSHQSRSQLDHLTSVLLTCVFVMHIMNQACSLY